MTTTRTFSTTDIVIVQMAGGAAGFSLYAEDFSYDTGEAIYPERVARFINAAHMRTFTTMAAFTEWLHEVGAIVRDCWVLGETLSDEERL